MAYTIGSNNVRTQAALTDAQQAAITALKAAGGPLAGLSAAQAFARLRIGIPITNPDPQGATPAVTIPRETLEIAMGACINAVTLLDTTSNTPNQTTGMTNAQLQVIFNAKLNFLQRSTIDPVPVVGQTTADIDALVAHGVITQDAATALLTVPDPNWTQSINSGPLAFEALGSWTFPELSDLTALGFA